MLAAVEVSFHRVILKVEEVSVSARYGACRLDVLNVCCEFLNLFDTMFQSVRSWELGSPRK
jgi:hypothetical protein